MKFFRTEARLAKALGIYQSAVQQWGDIVPRGAACELEVITAGALRVDFSLYARQRKA